METIESLEATAEKVAELPLEVVEHVLWHAGDWNLGRDGGLFVETLLTLIGRADLENRTRLASGEFGPYVAGWVAAREGWSLELLRQRVKDAEALLVARLEDEEVA